MADEQVVTTGATTQEGTVSTESTADTTTETTETTEVESSLLSDAGKEEKVEVKDGEKEEAKDGAKEGEEKSEEGDKVPESYTFKLPDGMTLDKVTLDKFTPVFKEIGITQKQAQKLVDVYAPMMQQQAEAQRQSNLKVFKEMVDEWKADTQKAYGGENKKELAFAAKFRNKFISPELEKLLTDTGVGNHVELLKCFVKAGKMLGEDNFPSGDSRGSGADTLSLLYPSMKK